MIFLRGRGKKRPGTLLWAGFFAATVLLVFLFYKTVLTGIGEFLVIDEKPRPAHAAVVLNTGAEYFPRLREAAGLYKGGYAGKVAINGNRKTDALRGLEAQGFKPCCQWYEERVRILELLGVPRDKVIIISAENAYDTISEAQAVGSELLRRGVSTVIVTTSKSHTRRARHVWEFLYQDRIKIRVKAAQTDPYSPLNWWQSGRQIRWVLSEYGAWVYYFWRRLQGNLYE